MNNKVCFEEYINVFIYVIKLKSRCYEYTAVDTHVINEFII